MQLFFNFTRITFFLPILILQMLFGGCYQIAIPMFNASLMKECPSDSLLQEYYQGRDYYQEERLEDAAVIFKDLLDRHPEFLLPYLYLGAIYRRSGDFDQAITMYQEALQFGHSSPEIHYNLAIAYQERGQLQRAVEEYHEALLLNPTLAEAYLNLGIIYEIFLNQNNKALDCYQLFVQNTSEEKGALVLPWIEYLEGILSQ